MADPKAEQNPVTVGFIDTGPTVSQRVPVTAANPLPVVIAASGPDADVNIAAVAGVATTSAGVPVTEIAGLTVKYKAVTASASGATTSVAAVSLKKIRVLQWIVSVNAAVNFKWQSHVIPTDLTGLFYTGGQGQGVGGAWNPGGHFETIVGEALDINLSGSVAVGGTLTYIEV